MKENSPTARLFASRWGTVADLLWWGWLLAAAACCVYAFLTRTYWFPVRFYICFVVLPGSFALWLPLRIAPQAARFAERSFREGISSTSLTVKEILRPPLRRLLWRTVIPFLLIEILVLLLVVYGDAYFEVQNVLSLTAVVSFFCFSGFYLVTSAILFAAFPGAFQRYSGAGGFVRRIIVAQAGLAIAAVIYLWLLVTLSAVDQKAGLIALVLAGGAHTLLAGVLLRRMRDRIVSEYFDLDPLASAPNESRND